MGNMAIIPLLAVLVLLLAFSAFFAGSETALMAVSPLRLRQLAKSKPRRVKTVQALLAKPEKIIGTILLGNNLVNVAMSAIATAIAISLWGESGIVYVTVILTVVILIFADITPKVYAKIHNDGVSLLTAPVLKGIMTVLNPFVLAITWVAGKLLLVFGININKTKKVLVTEADVKTLIQIGWEDGAINAQEKEMLTRIFTLDDKTVKDIMIPRNRVVSISDEFSVEQAVQTIRKFGYTRFPVTRGRSREIIGFIHAKDLLGQRGDRRIGTLTKEVRKAYFIPEDRKIDRQLRSFKSEKLHMAIVTDGEGEVTGMVTLEDIMEELVGSIEDEYDRER